MQASASPTDTTYANQTKSAAILEKLYDRRKTALRNAALAAVADDLFMDR